MSDRWKTIALAIIAPIAFVSVMALSEVGILAITDRQLSADQWLRGIVMGWIVTQAFVLIILWQANRL